MSFVDKLKFWEKKEEDPFKDDPFTGDFKYPTGIDSPNTPPPGSTNSFSTNAPTALTTSAAPAFGSETAPPRPMPQPRTFPSAHPEPIQQPKDLEIISLKLDAIKNSLESINMRLERLEKLAQGEPQKPNKVWYR